MRFVVIDKSNKRTGKLISSSLLRTTRWPNRRRLSAVVVSLLLLASCGFMAGTEERLARGTAAFEQGDFRAAAIDARSVLLDEPDNVAARLLLGRTAIRLGDPVAAEKELRRAVTLGTQKHEVAVDLALAQLQQGLFQQLLTEAEPASLTDVAERQSLYRLIGLAQIGMNDPESARAAFAQALAIDDTDKEAKLGIVRSYIAEANILQGRMTLTEVLQSDPEYADAWTLSGLLHLRSGQPKNAYADFERANEFAIQQELPAQRLQALSGLVDASILLNDMEAARRHSATLEELAPGSIRALQLAARVAFTDGKLDVAQQKLHEVLRRDPKAAESRLMLGAIHLQNGNLGQAEMHLSLLVSNDSENTEARRLLAETRLQLAKLGEAAEILRPLVGTASADSRSLDLAARVSLASGNVASATEYLQRSLDNRPGDVDAILNLALAHLMAGRLEAARELVLSVDVGQSEDSEFRRDLLMVLADVGSSPQPSPDSVIALRDKWPNLSAPHKLYGLLLLKQQQLEAARASFEAAVRLSEDAGSLYYIAQIDEIEGKRSAASDRYRRILALDAGNVNALIALARLDAMAGNTQGAIDWLQRARAANSNAQAPRIVLGRLLNSTGRFDEAIVVLTEALASDNDNAEANNAIGTALLGSGKAAEAVEKFQRAADIAPENRGFQLDLARAFTQAGNKSRAMEILDDSDREIYQHLPSGIALAQLRATDGDTEGAIAIASELRKLHPSSALPIVLHAEIEVRRNNFSQAGRLYDEVLRLDLSPRNAVRAFVIRQQAGADDPIAPLNLYLRQQGADSAVLLALAAYQQQHGMTDASVSSYRQALDHDARNYIAANNLAWMYFEMQDPRAGELARQAYTLAPNNSSVADTFGWILVNSGRLEEGLPILQKAVELNPSPEIEYHLAAALANAGRKGEARGILERLLATDAEFDSRDAAETLLTSL
jgi:putative PEP-CTERM system TPR-repeat lipoprotein